MTVHTIVQIGGTLFAVWMMIPMMKFAWLLWKNRKKNRQEKFLPEEEATYYAELFPTFIKRYTLFLIFALIETWCF